MASSAACIGHAALASADETWKNGSNRPARTTISFIVASIEARLILFKGGVMALFGGDQPDHPMADLKQAKRLIAELPANDSLKALDETTFWLDSICRNEAFKVDSRYELFGLLDQAARIHQRKLSQEYLATDRHEKFRENKLWTTIFEFWKTLGDAYSQCVRQFQAGADGSSSIRQDLPAIVARALRTLRMQLKWKLLRYGPVDDRVWEEIGRLYLFAETKGMATTTPEPVPGVPSPGSVQQEFLSALMLGVSSTDGLTPLKQEIAERTVAHFGSLYVQQAEPAPGCNFCFDLSMSKPPMRVMNGLAPGKMIRFFGAGGAQPALEQLIQEIKTKDSVPSHINLGGTYEANLVRTVTQHLARYWSNDPPARNSQRRKIATRMTVVHGFRNTLRCITSDDDANSLDFVAHDGSESWIVENVSDGGFGAIIPLTKGEDWISVGMLLGVQRETAPHWGAGVVRRIARDEYQQRRIGIELLSNTLIPVNLAPAGTVSSFNATREGDTAVLLSTASDKKGEIALLLRGGGFTSGQMLEMSVRGKRYNIMPSKLVEGGDDFDWAIFKVVKQ